MNTYWMLVLKRIYHEPKYLTYDSKLKDPMNWRISAFTCSAKTWKNEKTAQKWADIGNELINRFGVSLDTFEPIEAEYINYIMVPKNGTNR